MSVKWWLPLLILVISSLALGGYALLDKKDVAGLQVTTNQVATAVFLNDQYLDQAPLINKELKPGTYQLRLEPNQEQLASYQTQINLRKNLLTVVNWQPGPRIESSGGVIYELEPVAGKRAEISFVTIPDNVLVQFDDREQTFSPVTFRDLEPGTHRFSLTLTAYEKQEHSLELPQGHKVTVTAKLARLDDETFSTLSMTETATTSSAREASLASQLPPALDSASTSGKLKIQATNYFENDVEVLKVRAEPSLSAQKIGTVTVGQTYPYLGQTKNGWHQLEFNNKTGWVSADYTQLETE